MPGCAIAAVRHNRPTVIVYGGTIQVGERHVDCPAMGYKKGDPVNISDAFESYGDSRSIIGDYNSPWLLTDNFGTLKAHLLWVKLRRNNALMLYSTHVLAPEPAAGCTRTSFSIREKECTTQPLPSDRANTMSSALEVLGLSLPYSSSTPATYDGAFLCDAALPDSLDSLEHLP